MEKNGETQTTGLTREGGTLALWSMIFGVVAILIVALQVLVQAYSTPLPY